LGLAVPIQTAFNGGKFGKRLKGRTDLARYAFGCEELQNFIPIIQGPAVKRSGTRFVAEAAEPNVKSRLIPFVFSETQSYVMELGVGELRFFRNNGAVLETAQTLTGSPTAANPVQVPLTAHGYSNGDTVYLTGGLMVELNGRFFTVANSSVNVFDLSGEDGTGRVTGTAGTAARQYRLTHGVASNDIPWLEAELAAVQFVQNGDLMYLVHENHPPHEIIRSSDTSWTCKALVFNYPPFEEENTDDTITVSIDNPLVGAGRVITGVGTNFTAADIGRTFAIGVNPDASDKYAPWAATRVGTEIGQSVNNTALGGYLALRNRVTHEGRVYYTPNNTPTAFGKHPPLHEEGVQGDGLEDLTFVSWGWGYGTITAVASVTSCTITVVVEMPVSAATAAGYTGATTDRWKFGAWDSANGYPSSVGFYEDRLWFGGTTAEPQTVWGSQTGDYDDFRTEPADFDDVGLQFTFLSDKLNKIRWLHGDSVLFAGTDGGEFTVDSGSASAAITPSNVRVRRRSSYGSGSTAQPQSFAASLVFARKNADLRELTFSFDSDRYVAPDLTQFAHLILRPGITQLGIQPDPFQQLWVVKDDGKLAAMTFDRQEDVLAWCDVVLGGTTPAVDSIAIIPHPDGDEDQVWACVSRTVNGQTRRFIEYFEKPFEDDNVISDAFFVDAGSTYSGAAATTITGLWHLEGESVVILADGSRVADQTVVNGSVTLSTAAETVTVGLQMGSARLRTLPWNSSTSTLSSGTSQGWLGRVTHAILRVVQAGNGVEYGTDFDTMDTWTRRTPADLMGSPVPLFTGDSPVLDMPGGWEQARQLAIRYDEPLPLTVGAIIGRVETELP